MVNHGNTPIPFWSPGHKNRPDVVPPAVLWLIFVLAILSVVGTIVYATFTTLLIAGTIVFDVETGTYIAVLHFLLPMLVAYTIHTNSPLNRYLVAAYVLILGTATAKGQGFLGGLPVDNVTRTAMVVLLAAGLLSWLFLSPKARFYYALVAGRPVPDDLLDARGTPTIGQGRSFAANPALQRLADHLQTMVVLGFIAVVMYAFLTIG